MCIRMYVFIYKYVFTHVLIYVYTGCPKKCIHTLAAIINSSWLILKRKKRQLTYQLLLKYVYIFGAPCTNIYLFLSM